MNFLFKTFQNISTCNFTLISTPKCKIVDDLVSVFSMHMVLHLDTNMEIQLFAPCKFLNFAPPNLFPSVSQANLCT